MEENIHFLDKWSKSIEKCLNVAQLGTNKPDLFPVSAIMLANILQ